MINSILVNSGYASELPALKNRTISFTKGLNFLFGPNACGKSSVLKILAGYTGSSEGGWSFKSNKEYSESIQTDNYAKKEFEFPEDILANKCKAIVDWDGSPTYFSDIVNDSVGASFGSTDMSFEEEVITLVSKPSEGSKRLQKISKMYKELPNPTIWDKLKCHKESEKQFIEYVKTLSQTGPKTILLDEPDKSLSIENQIMLWFCMQTAVTNGFQVIIATHNITAIVRELDANIIDMVPGYLDYGKKLLGSYINGGTKKDIMEIVKKK